MDRAFCTVAECLNPIVHGGLLCEGHRQRKHREAAVSGELLCRPKSPSERLFRAALAYQAASDVDEDEYARAADNLRKSAIRYARSLPSWHHRDDERQRRKPAKESKCRT